MAAITWTSDTTFEVDGTEYLCDQYGLRRAHEPTRFCVAKHPRIIERYAELLAELDPATIVEVGILEGASTALFAGLAEPDVLVALEYAEAPTDKLRDHIKRRGLEDVIRVHGGVDQADVATVAALVEADLAGAELDLVVDDASHLYGPSLATFNCLFPRLRPGGVYVLEDWATSLKADGPTELATGDHPLVQLVFDAIAAKGRQPRLIRDVTVRSGWTTIVRGDVDLDGPFDVRTI